MRVSWINTGTVYRRMEGDITNIDTVPVGIYEIGANMSGWFLTKVADKFTFNHKVYNINNDFIDYIEKTYNNTTGNMGILLTGLQGSGKTVDAKCIANKLNLPVIIVKPMEDNNNLLSFLFSLNFDCVLFFDEFEKQFGKHDSFILQIMDGVYTNAFRKVFLLTTNSLDINEHLLSRPSRIRYVRKYGNINKSVVEAYLQENLNDTANADQLLDYIDTLTISTIDILKTIVEEVNIHGVKGFLKQKSTFNVETASYIYRTTQGKITKELQEYYNYTIDSFLKEVDVFENYYKYNDIYKQKKEKVATQEEVNRLEKEFRDLKSSIASMDRRSTEIDKPYYKLIPNKDYFRYEPVIIVDTVNHVVVTRSTDYFTFHYINNYDSKPSLYSPSTVISNDDLF